MYFLIEDFDLLKNIILFEIKSALMVNGIKREFDSKSVYNENFLKTKMQFYGDEATDFHVKKCLRQVLVILV